MMARLFAISGCALASALAASLFATAAAAQDVTTDIGTLDKATAEKVFPAKPPYSPYAGRNFPTRPTSATHTPIPPFRWTPAHSARGFGPRRPIVSPRARR